MKGFEVKSIHNEENQVEAVQNSQAIFIGGGNTFRLLKKLYDLKLIDAIRKRVLQDGIPYMGASAGNFSYCSLLIGTPILKVSFRYKCWNCKY